LSEVKNLSKTWLSLKGKVVLVAGGTNDIGEAVCSAFARAGASVFVVDADKARGKDLETRLNKEGYETHFYKGDVTKSYDLKKALKDIEKNFGRLDVLVNSATSALIKTVEETTEEEWDHLMTVNLKGAFLAVKHALPLLRQGDEGRIINISSVYGMVGAANRAAYSASKGGLTAFSRQLAAELAPEGITVNNVSIGGVETQAKRHYLRTSRDPEAAQHELLESIPLERLARPQEVAGVVLFLASDKTRFMTGANLVIDGGYTAT